MAFLDEDQPYAPRRAPAPRRRGPERQQIAVRRGIAVVVGILILILLIIGIKGCLNARKQRGLENYVSDVNSLVTSSGQLSDDFFKQLQNPGASGLDLKAAIDSDRGTAEGLLTRARDISAPGEVSGAKGTLILTFQLRLDGIAGLAAALDAGGSAKATSAAAIRAVDHMKELVASDVMFIRSKDATDQALAAAGVNESVKPSVFFKDPQRWLDPAQLAPLITSSGAGSVAGTACPPKKVCGLALSSTAIGGATLTPSSPATVTGTAIDVSVQNQGSVDESNVQVSYTLSGGGRGSATIPTLPAGATKTVTVKLKPAPHTGDSGTLKVSVQPVPGEHLTSNNHFSYPITFG